MFEGEGNGAGVARTTKTGSTHKLRRDCYAVHHNLHPVGPEGPGLFLSFHNCSITVDFHPEGSMVSPDARGLHPLMR